MSRLFESNVLLTCVCTESAINSLTAVCVGRLEMSHASNSNLRFQLPKCQVLGKIPVKDCERIILDFGMPMSFRFRGYFTQWSSVEITSRTLTLNESIAIGTVHCSSAEIGRYEINRDPYPAFNDKFIAVIHSTFSSHR